MIASVAEAETPIFVEAIPPYSLELQISQNGQTLCETKIEVTESSSDPVDSNCSLSISNNGTLDISGRITGDAISGRFSNTLKTFDMAPFTRVLRDRTVDFGDRIDAYHAGILARVPDINDKFRLRRIELPGDLSVDQILNDAANSAGASIPQEMGAFVDRRVILDNDDYIGPMNQRSKGTQPFDWPSLSEHLIYETLEPDHLPDPGTELRAWYDRVRVVFFYLSGDHSMIVWDPRAPEGSASFYSVSMDNYSRPEGFLYPDGTPVSAEDALLSPLVPTDWQNWFDEYLDAAEIDPENPEHLIFDSSAYHGRFVIQFMGNSSRFNVFRTVKPAMHFQSQTWWRR